MPKFSLHIEADSLHELREILGVSGVAIELASSAGEQFPDDTAAEQPEAAEAPKKPRAKAKLAAVPPAASTKAQLEASVEATDPATANLPTRDLLVGRISNAVRLAQKGEGDPKILSFLPAFKEKTGLSFVMEAKEEHRAALFELANAAGLAVV